MMKNINKAISTGFPAKRYTKEELSQIQIAYEHLSKGIIDEFRHQSWFFDHMPCKLVKNAVDGGGTTAYKYDRVANLASATAREYNSEVEEMYVELTSEEANIANLASAISMDVDPMGIGDLGVWYVRARLHRSLPVITARVFVGPRRLSCPTEALSRPM